MAYKYVQFDQFLLQLFLAWEQAFEFQYMMWWVKLAARELAASFVFGYRVNSRDSPKWRACSHWLCLSQVRISCSKTVWCPAGNSKLEILWLFVSIGCRDKNTFRDICDRRCKCKNGKLVSCYRVRQEFFKMSLEERTRLIKASNFFRLIQDT